MGAYGILLIAALVIVSGVIAYVGDILGRWMGKRRMTLFNLRPRHTAIVTSVVAGMMIAVLTLASAMGVSRNVRDGLTKVGLLRGQNQRLHEEQRALRRQTEAANRSLDEARKALGEADKRLAALNAKVKAAEKQVKDTQAKLGAARAELEEQGAEVRRGERILAEQYREVEQLRRALRTFGTVYTKRLIFQVNDPILATEINGDQTEYVIYRELREFVGQVNEAAREAGAGAGTDGKAITIFKIAVENGKEKRYSEEEVLDALTDGVAETKAPVIVRAVSVGNAVEGEPVLVDFELFRNQLVFHKGDEIARISVNSADSQSRLFSDLVVLLLRGKVAQAARGKGIMPGVPGRAGSGSVPLFPEPRESVGTISYDDLLAAITEIKARSGTVAVVARASEDTWTAGPLKIELTVGS